MNQQAIESHKKMLSRLRKLAKEAVDNHNYQPTKEEYNLIKKFFADRQSVVRVDETEVYNQLKQEFPAVHQEANKQKAPKLTAAERVVKLYDKVKKDGNCEQYVKEICAQLELLGTETNTLTKLMVRNELTYTLTRINESFK